MRMALGIKKFIKRMPLVGGLLRRSRGSAPSVVPPAPPPFVRAEVDSAGARAEQDVQRCKNLLNYAKRGGKAYSAHSFPGGYHTLTIHKVRLEGQRSPQQRLALVPFDFESKTVLDVGSNQGGMLFELAPGLKWAVGIDYDPRMVNVANRIAVAQEYPHVRFYHFDVVKEPLDIIGDLLPESKVDVVFLLSVCMWIDNWKELISYLAGISGAMLFESNGTQEQQVSQEEELRRTYVNVQQLAAESSDDAMQKRRKLFFCTEPVR